MSNDSEIPPINGSIHVLCAIFKNVMTFATEAETGGVCWKSQVKGKLKVKSLLTVLLFN